MKARLIALLLFCLAVAAGQGQSLGAYSDREGPELTALSAIVVNPANGEVLWDRGGIDIRTPASTTKIMTAMIFIEKVPLDQMITVGPEVNSAQGSKIGLRSGDTISAEHLLQGIMVRSGNDACLAAAVRASGTVEAFVQEMNDKAKELGATSTTFKNPHGYHEEGHVTTAADLAKIALAAIKLPDFRRVILMPEIELVFNGGAPQKFRNRSDLVGKDPTNLGIKTGWTDEAGRCFVGWHKNDDLEFVSVILGSPRSWVPDQEALRDWVFATFENKTLVKKGAVLGKLNVAGALGGPVSLVATKDLAAIVPKDLAASKLEGQPKLKAPLGKGAKGGKVVWEGGLEVPLTIAEGRMAWWQPVLSVVLLLSAGAFLIWRRNNMIRARMKAQRQRELDEIRRRARGE